MTSRDESPTLIRTEVGRLEGKKWITTSYAYMAKRATIFDEQLIHWAEAREKWLKEKGLPIRPPKIQKPG